MNNGIRKQPRRERLIVANGNTSDIINVVMQVANDDQLSAQVCDFAQRFKGTNAEDQYRKLKELWKFTRKEISYEEDPPGVQYIKEPGRVYWDNQKGDGSDCKSLSLFEYFVCRCIGVPCYFEFVSYFSYWEDSKKRITHVYPVAIIPGWGEVVIDAVHTKFDERAPGATRIVKKYSKVFKQMSDIYRVSGIKKNVQPTAADLQAENTDRAKLVKPLSYVDFPMMSEGEMETFLLADRDRILSQFFQGTPQGAAYRQAFERMRDALAAGLHRGSFNFFGAKSKTRSASGWLPLAAKGVDLRKGFSALFEDSENGADRVSGPIEQLDCDTLYPTLTQAQWQAQNPNAPINIYQTYANNQANLLQACKAENDWRTILNEKFPQSGHYPLYNFATPANKTVPTVATKSVLHINAIGSLGSLSKINSSLLKTWQENGILAANIAKGAGPLSPQESILALKKAEVDGIGDPITIGVVIAIIGAITDALNAARGLLASIKNKQPTAAQTFQQNTQGWGTQSWGPEKSDWIYIDPATGQQIDPSAATGNNLLSNDNLPLILLGVGGAALLIGSKK